jgi:import receptor subunit TOM20
MLSRSTLGLAAAGAGLAFVGYCIYFDHKRRSDPLYKVKLREKRKKAKQNAREQSKSGSQFPDLQDTDSMQKFFLQEVQLGEELLASGDIEQGVEHLSNAVAVCGQPQQLLQVLQQSLPPQVFQLLLLRLPVAGRRITASVGGPGSPMMMGGPLCMNEDDLE